ncbi:MAG TPA: hypothetical protein VKU39_18230 [Streptosporangiaceae bacterium]|nr:hypothetical protein [Streptosporangiaceae bacterium]
MTVGNRSGDDTTGPAGNEPREAPAELTGGQSPPAPADERDAIRAAVPGGMRALVAPGSWKLREQVSVPVRMEAFQDLDSPLHGFADDPGGGDADGVVFPLKARLLTLRR